jgi:hypothetical protein
VGVYHLNGNNFSLNDFALVTGTVAAGAFSSGLFESLLPGSLIQNLVINGANLTGLAQTVPTSANTYIGLLAGQNAGEINNIQVRNGKILIKDFTISSGGSLSLGGLVGRNFSTGLITKSETDIDTELLRPISVGGIARVAGAAAINEGTISVVRQNGQVKRNIAQFNSGSMPLSSYTCSPSETGKMVYNSNSTPVPMGYYYCDNSVWYSAVGLEMQLGEMAAGFVALNTGVIQEVDIDGEVSLNDLPTNDLGIIAPFIAINSGQIRDVSFRGRLNSNHAVITNFFPSFTGSVSRMLIKIDSFFGADFTTANSIIPISGTSEMLCVKGTSMPDCHNLPKTYEFSPGLFSISENGTNIGTFTDWNMTTGFLPDMTKTWQLDGAMVGGAYLSMEAPQLMRTGGDFSKIGKGF